MEFELRQLGLAHKDALVDLFVSCFREDRYYRKLFRRKTGANIRKLFAPVLEEHLAHSIALGAFAGESLAGFLLCFDYGQLKAKNRPLFNQTFTLDKNGPLPYEEELHRRVEALDGRVIYVLSIAVAEQYRRQGAARAMLLRVLKSCEGCSFASDVSSQSSLNLCRELGFQAFPIEEGYWYVQHGQMRAEPELGERVPVAFPSLELIHDVFGPSFGDRPIERLELQNFQLEICQYTDCFKRKKGERCTAMVAELTYQELLEYQRYINLAHQEECWIETRQWGPVLFYHLIFPYDGPLLWNDTLREMIRTRQNEWNTIGDTYTLFPVEYAKGWPGGPPDPDYDPQMQTLLHFLDFRTHYETGIPRTGDEVDEMSDFKKRIRRWHLGKLKIKITQELSPDCYLSEGETEGQPGWVDLVLSVDERTKCGVLTMVSLSLPFLLSHYMDNIIRNQLLVQDRAGDWINFYEYIHREFGLYKRGTPKIFCVIPREKDCLTIGQIASLLMGETIYASDEELGGFCDEEVLSAICSEHGMGQYDRAFVCANSNVLLQFGEGARGLVRQRMAEEAITCFYMELILFEESAIQIADSAIVEFFTRERQSSTTAFLKNTYRIYEDYADTIAFWDVQVNYPSSRKSIAMLRRAFQIEEQLGYLKRDQEQLLAMFDTKSAIMDRADSAILNYIMLLLALIEGVSIVAPDLFTRISGLPIGSGAILAVLFFYRAAKQLATRTGRNRQRMIK